MQLFFVCYVEIGLDGGHFHNIGALVTLGIALGAVSGDRCRALQNLRR
jgi:hypothetical protein